MLLSTIVLSALSAAAPQPSVVAVFGLRDERPKGERLSASANQSLTTYITTLVAQSRRFRVVPSSEVQRALRQAKRDSYDECYDERCQIEIGKAVAAELSIDSRVGRVGTSCLVTSTLFDLREETTVRAASVRGACTEDAMANAVEQLIPELVEGPTKTARVPAPMLTHTIDLPLSDDPTRAAFPGTDEEWRARRTQLGIRLDEEAFESYSTAGLPYGIWAKRYNAASESWLLEISKWVFTALSAVALTVAIVDRDARQASGFWIASSAAAFGPAALTWGLDLPNIGDVPEDP